MKRRRHLLLPMYGDGGSARMMAAPGFPALATSSGASAGLLGRRDGRVTREEALAQARVICDATDLPVSADLEKGFGDAPEVVAETSAHRAQIIECRLRTDRSQMHQPACRVIDLHLCEGRFGGGP
jgi:2-methylisocitrate lyase-like PEP mutase family enzyme